MDEKIKRFEQAVARTANHSLIDFWNDLEADLSKREAYIAELEEVNLALQLRVQNQDKLKRDSNLLFQSYENMKVIAFLNKKFV